MMITIIVHHLSKKTQKQEKKLKREKKNTKQN
jgi:hypothetical protein